MVKIRFVYLYLIVSLLIIGCGNAVNSHYILTVPRSKASSTTGEIKSGANTDYICPESSPGGAPGSANVTPYYDLEIDGSGYFQVCTRKDQPSDILIHGKTAHSDTICIFPAEVVFEERLFIKPDLKTGAPLSECVQATDEGVFTSFKDIKYNAVFIVEKQNKEQMQSCLTGSNFFACPSYSYGKFR